MGRRRPERFPRRRTTDGGTGPARPTLRLRLTPGIHAAATARRELERLEDVLEEPRLEDLRLLVTELVTNAVRHADAPAGEVVDVEVSVLEDRVRVEVRDAGSGFDGAPRQLGHDPQSGWGLQLVERLSDGWGVVRGARNCVWFEMSRAVTGRPSLRLV